MYYTRSGFPQEGEKVIVVVTKIQYHSVFVKLVEYKDKSGLLHISEIAPGRIRSINEYVKEGKTTVCKVLRVDEQKGHIDLSLRRVSEAQRIERLSLMKQELKAEKIIEATAQELKSDVKKFYEKLAKVILKKYDYIYDFFFEVALNQSPMDEAKLPVKEAKVLETLIRARIKQPLVELGGKLKMISYLGNGAQVVRDILDEADALDEHVTIRYLGAGTYKVRIVTKEYKDAEHILQQVLTCIQKRVDNKQTFMHFAKEEGKKIEAE
ncbi:MAG: S1 RNA-binding domain-containing protein [Candidatus Woesearchaeota archaeon]